LLGRTLFGAVSAFVLVAAGIGWYLHSSVLGGLATSHALVGLGGSGHPDGDVNVLLMGLDSRRDNQGNDLPPAILNQLHAGSSSDVGGYNTNTLILLHVPADGSRAVALSIPRDDYVDLPEGLGKHKIKEAYGRAKASAENSASSAGTGDRATLEQVGREAGRHAAIDAVQQLLGVTVDHFAEINLAGFYDLANALGGVQVCLRGPVHDWYSGADFPAGLQTLNGAQALAFVRQRHGLTNGDLDRTHRQQAFLASAVHKLRESGVFDDLSKVGALLDVARKDVVVDSGFDLLSFMQQAGAVTSGNVTFYTLPIQGFATEDGESVNVIDPVQVRTVAQRLLAGGVDAGGGSSGAADAELGPVIPQAVEQAGSPSPTSATHRATRIAATKRASSRGNHARSAGNSNGGAGDVNSGAGDVSEGAGYVNGGAGAAPSAHAPNVTAPPGIPCVD
jgi:LCP family protein required for cell wall assembly